jgi:hypothetical protein
MFFLQSRKQAIQEKRMSGEEVPSQLHDKQYYHKIKHLPNPTPPTETGENTSESFYLALRSHNAATVIWFILSFLRLLSHRGKMNETSLTLMEDFGMHLRNASDGVLTYSASFFATQMLEAAA